MPWTIIKREGSLKRLKNFQKKWRQEVTNVFDNLDTLAKSLNKGVNPEQAKKHSFVHGNYPLGMLSIDERGPGKKSKKKPLRLYVFPREEKRELHILILGDKDTQKEDIALAKAYVSGLIQNDHGKGSPEEESLEDRETEADDESK